MLEKIRYNISQILKFCLCHNYMIYICHFYSMVVQNCINEWSWILQPSSSDSCGLFTTWIFTKCWGFQFWVFDNRHIIRKICLSRASRVCLLFRMTRSFINAKTFGNLITMCSHVFFFFLIQNRNSTRA